jgi:hypothetical protein
MRYLERFVDGVSTSSFFPTDRFEVERAYLSTVSYRPFLRIIVHRRTP